MSKDDISKSINSLNQIFKNITKSYNMLSSKMDIIIDKELLTYNNLINLEVSMNDLLININTILFTIDQSDIDNNIDTELENNKEVDNLINKTLINMMPLLMLYFMIIDNKSILNNPNFGKLQDNNIKDDNNYICVLPIIELD